MLQMLWDSAARGVKVNMATAGPSIVALALIVAWSGFYHSERFDTRERGGMKCFTKRAMAASRRGVFGHIEAWLAR